MRHLVIVLTLAAGCGETRFIEGPYSGRAQRLVVDGLTLPQNRYQFAVDLDGDGNPDNRLGSNASSLSGSMNLTRGTVEMLAAGALQPTVELISEDSSLRHDDAVGVRFLGVEGAPADTLGAAIVDGKLTTNPVRALPAETRARLVLPLFLDADPLVLDTTALQIELTPDGAGGFHGIAQGALRAPDYLAATHAALRQMLAAQPAEHILLMTIIDRDQDGMLSESELLGGLLGSALRPDVDLFDAEGRFAPGRGDGVKDGLSFGFGFHLKRCEIGRCNDAPPADRCLDRVLDGDESDVDCGPGCLPCAGGLRCTAGADCQSGRCESGVCAAPSCDDGVLDGFEGDVDCGARCSRACAIGQGCFLQNDCASDHCSGSLGTRGICQAPF